MKHILLLIGLLPAVALAQPTSDAQHDPHRLSAAELHAFLPAVCVKPKMTKDGFDCAELSAYPSDGAAFDENANKASGEISLSAVAYGRFTAKGGDEAYVTYSGLEPHSQNFGGGILLARTYGAWKAVRWIPGGQMDNCIAAPDPEPQKMLCLSGYAGMGEADTSVWLYDLSGVRRGADIKRTSVLKAQDGREASNPDYYCKPSLAARRDMLLSIDNLKRSHLKGVFATSQTTFATAGAVRSACKQKDFSNVETKLGVVRYWLGPRGIRLDPPPNFAAVDY